LETQFRRKKDIALLTGQLNTLLERAEADAAGAKQPEQRDLKAILLQSCDQALVQARSTLLLLQKAFSAAEANEQSQRELTVMRVELNPMKSESVRFSSQLADLENVQIS
jgi:folate-dependent tRNA-U54 methylase TrmFO/GidA